MKSFPGFQPADTLGYSWSGEAVTLTDHSNEYDLLLPSGTDRTAAIGALRTNPSVELAVANGGVNLAAAPVYPNDPLFKDGTEWGAWGTPTASADVDAPGAWGITTGVSNHEIAIIDTGFDESSPEFSGRVLGSLSTDSSLFDECINHGYRVAGIAGASGGNGAGIAGMDWHAGLRNEFVTAFPTNTDLKLAIQDAYKTPAVRVINASWNLTTDCGHCDVTDILNTITDAYNMNKLTVAAMGNTGTSTFLLPAAMNQGVLAVGSTDQSGNRYSGSTIGDWIDVVAPGVDITSTVPGGYASCTGTSFATPFVSGIASLLCAEDSTLYNDDLQNIIQISADDIGTPGKDGFTGWGRVNARKALQLTQSPNVFIRGTAVGKSVTDLGQVQHRLYVVEPGFISTTQYIAEEYEILADVSFPQGTFHSHPYVWGRGVGTNGLADPTVLNGDIFGATWCDTVPGVTQNGCTMRTYAYVITDPSTFQVVGTLPRGVNLNSPSSFHLNWSALEQRRVDPSQSYFVPQRGPVGTPIEGAQAVAFFRACPNNDGTTSLPGNARIKVVVRDPSGNGIPGISAADIFVLLNGGTPAQGLIGDGADSVVANSQYNPTDQCPDLRIIPADAPTDPTGTTYITFRGCKPDSPGVAMRDPSRKWGHYDSELPVYVLGEHISGHLTSDSNESYVLRIKNFDHISGLGTDPDEGETVSASDFNDVANHIGVNDTMSYWRDFDSSGSVSGTDFQILNAHMDHTCDAPDSP